jgi:hypothetical protein
MPVSTLPTKSIQPAFSLAVSDRVRGAERRQVQRDRVGGVE